MYGKNWFGSTFLDWFVRVVLILTFGCSKGKKVIFLDNLRFKKKEKQERLDKVDVLPVRGIS